MKSGVDVKLSPQAKGQIDIKLAPPQNGDRTLAYLSW